MPTDGFNEPVESSVVDQSVGRRISRSGLWSATGRIANLVALLVLHIRLANHWSLSTYGEYVLLCSVVPTLTVLATLGLPNVVVRLLVANWVRGCFRFARALIDRGFLVLIVWLPIVSAGYALFTWATRGVLFSGTLWNYVILTVAWLIVGSLSQMLGEVFRGINAFFWSSMLSGPTGGMAANVSLALVVLTPLSDGFTVRLLLICHILFLVGFLCLGAWILQRIRSSWASEDRVPPQQRHLDEATPLALMRQSTQQMATQLLSVSSDQLTTWVVGGRLSMADVAIFGTARRVTRLLSLFPMVANMAVAPFISEMHEQQQPRRLESIIRRSTTMAAIPAILAAIVVLLYPETMMQVFGKEYGTGAGILVILTLFAVVSVLLGNGVMPLLMAGKQWLAMWNEVVVTIFCLVVVPVAVIYWGLPGAAVATSLVVVFRKLGAAYLLKRNVDAWPMADLSMQGIQSAGAGWKQAVRRLTGR